MLISDSQIYRKFGLHSLKSVTSSWWGKLILYLFCTDVLLMLYKTNWLNQFMIRKKGKMYIQHVKMLAIIGSRKLTYILLVLVYFVSSSVIWGNQPVNNLYLENDTARLVRYSDPLSIFTWLVLSHTHYRVKK